jgi:phosphoribosylamine--glycine ligase
MKVLVIGGGGREHALCWKLAQSPQLTKLYCAPGNPGIAMLAERVDIGAEAIDDLVEFAHAEAIDLTVVGPEVPLTLGIRDRFVAAGLRLFGPSRAAAELEGSKVFAKAFMERHAIPTARARVVEDAETARSAAEDFGVPVVLKADGLAAGKGVLIPETVAELEAALDVFFQERRFGSSGARVVVEECLRGEEVSFIAITDGKRLLPLASSKDYKRVGEDDGGPNTGGMGAHSPSGLVDGELRERILEEIMQPTITGLAEEERPFSGFLYAGLMLTESGPKVLEFNVRLGDPEAQALLLRMRSDLLPVLTVGASGELTGLSLDFHPGASACVVLANEGYPGAAVTGDPIAGLDEIPESLEAVVFHAGTRQARDGAILASGGRVLNACARAGSLEAALGRAYALADSIAWPHKMLRRDIGRRIVQARRFAPD